ncbi:MAG: hypothetical protein IKY32_01865, partial [Phascolarctobacterium sp.]|nr:hypothetical protein [Phascolarctobacterium sp.]
MKFLKFPAVLAVACCFFINSIVNATAKEERELPVVKPVASKQEVKAPVKNEKKLPEVKAPAQNKKELPKAKVTPVKKEYFRGMELPVDYKSISIFGSSVATKGQAVNLIKANGSKVKLDCSIEEIVNLYWVEA